MARLLDSVLGQNLVIEAFLTAFAAGRIANTFLFTGATGIGKMTTALGLAQALLCEESPRACGRCGSCLRVAKGQHESLRIVKPEKQMIKIEQTREILDFLSLQSLTARRVVIIDEAGSLNPQAGNSLLKILEEPNPNTFFFLIAPSPSHVLATLRSRSQILSFRPLSLEDLQRKSSSPDWVLRAAQGSLERVRSFADPHEKEIRSLAIQVLQSWGREAQGFLRPDFRTAFREKSSALSLAKQLSFLLRDAVSWQLGERENLLNPDQTSLFQSLSERPQDQLQKTAQAALRLEGALLQNRDSQLLFEEFWIQSLQF